MPDAPVAVRPTEPTSDESVASLPRRGLAALRDAVGGINPRHVLPTRFTKTGFEAEMTAFIGERLPGVEREIAELRRAHPTDDEEALFDRLYGPLMRKLIAVEIGGATVEIVPIFPLLFSPQLEQHKVGSLLEAQILLITKAAVLRQSGVTAEQVVHDVLRVLDRVYGLKSICRDLGRLEQSALSRGGRAAVGGLIRRLARSVTAVVTVSATVLNLYVHYARFRTLRDETRRYYGLS